MDAWRQPPPVWGQWPYHRQVASSWARSTDIPKDPLPVGQSGGRADALGTPGCQCARWGECWQARWPRHHPGSQGTNSARDPVGVLHCCSHGVCEITGDGRRPALDCEPPPVLTVTDRYWQEDLQMWASGHGKRLRGAGVGETVGVGAGNLVSCR